MEEIIKFLKSLLVFCFFFLCGHKIGFGLISEVCPLHTVACRIRIEKDAVSFYEYSRLYDRNQFVCVLKGEFGEQKGSGCARKRSGHIRCWCFGRSNCNTPENSKLLYLTFIGGNEEKFKKAVESVDFVDLNNEEGEEEKEEEKFLKNKNWEKINITTTLSSAVIREDEELLNGNIKILNNGQEEEGGGKILKLENVLYETSDIKKAMGAKTVHLSEQFVDDSFTKSTQKLTTLISTIPINTKETTATTQKSTTIPNTIPLTTTTPKLPAKSFLNPSTVKSIYDSQNRVHVIHVSGRDRYDNLPVEQLLGSPALRRIMEEEREKLKNKVEDNSAEEEEEEGEGDNLDEDEELEEDWEFEKNNGEEDEEDLFKRTINNKTKITERRSSSLSKTKISQNSPKNLLKTQMEQRQRSSNNNKISSLEEDKESEEEEELKDLTDEYFDSAFFSPSKTSGCFDNCGKNYILKKIIILIIFIFYF
ncbi:unnamed protein product [Meloidogyne enterolobii]|uniref:Uncharacterized protein n=1 Tax=Meloidogyne enterolobii TaxID=390850 RepID=A0ACB1AJU4_MELEN